MSGINSPFQMERNTVTEFHFSQNNIEGNFDTLNIKLGVDYNMSSVFEDDLKYISDLNLLIKIEGVNEIDKDVFTIHLNMKGVFSCNKDFISKDEFLEMMKINGVSTTLQLSRAYITSVSALSGFDRPINLPMINVFELNRMKKENEGKDI